MGKTILQIRNTRFVFGKSKRLLKNLLLWLLLLALFATLSSCASRKVTVPSVSPQPTNTYHYGKFVWHDLLTDDIPAAKKFYEELFGWEFVSSAPQDTAFTVIKFNGIPIGSVVYLKRLNPDVSEARWLSSLSVPDVDKAVEYFRSNGGTVYREPKNYPNRGRLAVVADPQGAVLALLNATGGDPADAKPASDEWMWNELLTNNPGEAASFYEGLAGYQYETRQVTTGIDYHILTKNGIPRAGVVKVPWETVKPNWLPYIKVEDPQALAAQVEVLGGKLLLPPDKNIRNGSVAVVADPTGAAVALQKWPVEQEERSEEQ